MEEKSYINEELSLFKRMKSVFLPLFASTIILFTIVAMLNGKVEWFIYFLLISIYTVFFAIVTYFQSKSYIYAVHIKGTIIIIDGQTFNTKWTDNIEICNLKIEIKGEAQGKGHSEYVIILKSPDKKYKINSLYNWDYFKLIELFKELKISKDEKIIFDENFLIDRIEKKALGYSIIDINFGE
jgi:hypothetical protein